VSEKLKVRVGDDGELEYVPVGKRKKKRQSSALMFLGVACFTGILVIGALGASGSLSLLLCRSIGACSKNDSLKPTVRATTTDSPCSSEILTDQREKIAFISNRQSEFGAIHVMFPDSAQSCLLLDNEAGIDQLVLSPDRNALWFETSRGWWSIDLDGGNSHALNGTTTTQITTNQFSPDGAWALSTREINGNRDIYKVDAIGNEIRLTQSEERDIDANWSPDGNQIVFVSYRDGNNELYVMNADGSQTRRLTRNLADEHSPVWFK